MMQAPLITTSRMDGALMYRTSRSMLGLWASTLEAQAAMWTTLAVRVPQLMSGTMTSAEQTRMVSEKLEAISESAQNTSASLGRMLLNPVGMMQDPAAMMGAMMSLSSTAALPFHSRLKSNAKRLQKAKA